MPEFFSSFVITEKKRKYFFCLKRQNLIPYETSNFTTTPRKHLITLEEVGWQLKK